MSKVPAAAKATKPAVRRHKNNGRDLQRELLNLERTIARLDEQKRELSAQLLASTNADEALRLHNEAAALAEEIAAAEERWYQLQEAVGETA